MKLPELHIPPISEALGIELLILPDRRGGSSPLGRQLYLPRLGVTVLAHSRIRTAPAARPSSAPPAGWVTSASPTSTSQWLCTVVAASGHTTLPVGAGLITELELASAHEVAEPSRPHAGLSHDDLAAIWRLRVRAHWPDGPVAEAADVLLAAAELAKAADESELVLRDDVVLSRLNSPAITRIGQVLITAAHELRSAGYLLLRTTGHGQGTGLALVVPPAAWFPS